MGRDDNKVTCEIVEHIGTLSTKANGWSKEVNIVVWNHNEPKIDIREWDESHIKMSRGVTLTKEETVALLDTLKGWKGEK